ncbi:SRPBCC family protein [Mixta tenebrionis]|uniref:SRPBCC family protein n=2 Tax=Mixta tenebrionis TaxID=2562439 RepID=A0A506VH63_9GAMM|nr:SRPBCC family protein [Mixta tenebrionis]
MLRRWITVGQPADRLYKLWCDPATLPQIMHHFAEVSVINDTDAEWRLPGPLKKSYRWRSRIVDRQPGVVIAWESLEGADVPNEGMLQFRPAPGEWGTELTLTLRFNPPGGALGQKVTAFLDLFPQEQLSKALHRFKSLAETGEIPLLDGQPAGRHKNRQDEEA